MINYNMNRVLSALAAVIGIDKLPMGRAYANRRPTGAQLRNPECPFQAERIAKAQVKRDARLVKRCNNAYRSITNNYAHMNPWSLILPARLNPFSVNR